MKKRRAKKQALVSVIMPVYNAADYLVEAIESIRNQTYKNWELIMVDDGSTDESWKILKTYAKKYKRIKIYRFAKNKGLAYALNKALDKAKGYYIARMDADDISLPKRFETQIAYLEQNNRLVAVGSQVELINENGKRIGFKKFPQVHDKLYEMMMTMMAIQHPTLMTYRHIFKKCRYENHTTAEDVSMFFRLLQYGQFGNTPELLFQYRIRKNSNSLKDPKKTFHLTLRSRINAVIKWNYKPSPKGILINICQWIIISFLPNSAILYLYEFLRFNRQKVVKKVLQSASSLRFSLAR